MTIDGLLQKPITDIEPNIFFVVLNMQIVVKKQKQFSSLKKDVSIDFMQGHLKFLC